MKDTGHHLCIRITRRTLFCLAIASLAVLVAGFAQNTSAQTISSSRVQDATQVLGEIMSDPQTNIPPSLLQRSYAIAVIPKMFKIGFILGGMTGRGILLIRDAQGTWNGPVFITLRGTSIGIQSGVMLTDMVLVFRRSESLEALSSRNFIFGADVSIMAGPVSFQVDEMTDPWLSSEIYSFSQGLGLFVGVSLQGVSLEMDLKGTAAFYGNDALSIRDVLTGTISEFPPDAQLFRQTLAGYTEPGRQ